jgi:hypothetical protein
MTADEAALGLIAAKGLRDLRTREVGAQTLRQLAKGYRLDAVVQSLP